MTDRRGDGRRRQPNGQSMVEFALVLPVFLLIVFGLIDAGRLVFMNSTLSQASREAARTASVEAYWVGRTDPSCGTFGGPVCPADTATLKAHMTAAANQMMAPFGADPRHVDPRHLWGEGLHATERRVDRRASTRRRAAGGRPRTSCPCAPS